MLKRTFNYWTIETTKGFTRPPSGLTSNMLPRIRIPIKSRMNRFSKKLRVELAP